MIMFGSVLIRACSPSRTIGWSSAKSRWRRPSTRHRAWSPPARAGVPLFVNENWRWQCPIRQFKAQLDSGRIGKPFSARIDMISGFSVFKNQPLLAELEQFIITDLGSHTLDVARYDWANPFYDVVHSSIVPCQADLLKGLQGKGAETTGQDNHKTVQLVFGSYQSAASGQVLDLTGR
jgi:predicted dehydrogenase